MSLISKILSFTSGLLLSVSTFATAKAGNGYDLLPDYIKKEKSDSDFTISENSKSCDIYVDSNDWKGVIRAAADLGSDIEKVTGTPANLVKSSTGIKPNSIIIGTLGHSKLIDNLVKAKKIDVSDIRGQWESFIIETIGDDLYVIGSDKRGTIFGIYDISEKIGVSPWYWWADVPVRKSESLYLAKGRYLQESPKVKYRGIFINDEWPSFGGWTHAKFGGFKSGMYTKMFELLLRLKANYLWPAMWCSAFNEDDPMNPVLADEYGIVMGTSHHEPMMRAHREYVRRKDKIGPWDYVTNKENVKNFFIEGLENNKGRESIITIGMRGDGDSPMGKGNDEENMVVLKDVIRDQRQIIEDVYGKKASEVPQLWAIFTEVQRYYDAGLTVPDDVTLLFCDNNWGQIRRIGPAKERKRKGGMGLYYHIDMNGGPWNDRWVNTTTIPKLQEQLNLAYQTGIDRIWIINVGDLKPKEFPIDFIMRYAWNPDAIPASNTWDYQIAWARNIFGEEHAEEIADIVSKYSKYNLLRKPEVQHPTIFSHVNYNESDKELEKWHELVKRAEIIETLISPEARDAYYQLVLYPVKASAGAAEIYIAAGKNNIYAKQGRLSANDWFDRAAVLFELDKKLSAYYNKSMSDAKWDIMMSDNHFGYQNWAMPKENVLPEMYRVIPLDYPEMGVAVEGSENAWDGKPISMPVFDILNDNSYYVDVFNKGTGTFAYTVATQTPWIHISDSNDNVDKESRFFVSIDWDKAPIGRTEGQLTINDGKRIAYVQVPIVKYTVPQTGSPYFGGAGEFTIPANQYSRNIPAKNAVWSFVPDLGRGEGCMNINPVTAKSTLNFKNSPCLEYDIFLPEDGDVTAVLGVLPTQDLDPARGLRIAVAIDDDDPIILDARKGFCDTFNEYNKKNIERSKVIKALPAVNKELALTSSGKPRRRDIFDFIRWLDTNLGNKEAGMHTVKVYMVDPELVLDRLVINPDNLHPSYNGAPAKIHNI